MKLRTYKKRLTRIRRGWWQHVQRTRGSHHRWMRMACVYGWLLEMTKQEERTLGARLLDTATSEELDRLGAKG